MTPVITVEDYRIRITELLGRTTTCELPLDECPGLVLAKDIRTSISLPPFDNSAMDGYAVRSAEVTEASSEMGIFLPVAEDIPAGRTDLLELSPGTAHRIMTGAPIPFGADSVVMVEKTDGGTDRVRINEAVAPGTFIRRIGDDVVQGTTILTAGTVLSPAQLGLAAAVGLTSLEVSVPPRVLVVSTGAELAIPPAPLNHGQIYDANSIMIAATLRALGCRVEVLRSNDDVTEFQTILESRLGEIDLIVTSGGVSAGAYEVVKDGLTGSGMTFTKVAMQPGGPQGHGHWNGVPVVSLPGNPVSVLVSLEAFLRPALLASLGHRETDRPSARARVTESLQSPAGKRQFRRGHYRTSADHDGGNSVGEVSPRGGPGSHLLAAFSQSNCLIVLGEDITEVSAGEEVPVLLLR